MSILREIERYVILPFRFLKCRLRDCRDRCQKCKVCGQADGFDFHVPDDIWRSIVPKRLQNRVVCLRCFDRFAAQKGINYTPFIDKIYFCGLGAVLIGRTGGGST